MRIYLFFLKVKKVYSKLSLLERSIYLYTIYLFFSPFTSFLIPSDIYPPQISQPFEDFTFDFLKINYLAGLIFFFVSFLLIFRTYKLNFKTWLKVLNYIFLPLAISIFLVWFLIIKIFPIPTTSFNVGNIEMKFFPDPSLILKKWKWDVLASIGGSFLFPFLLNFIFVSTSSIFIYLWIRFLGSRINFIQVFYSILISLPIFYLGIFCEVMDRAINSFFIGDIIYSCLFILWILKLIKFLDKFSTKEITVKTLRNTLIMSTIFYYITFGLILLNNPQPFQREILREVMILHRFLLLLPVGCIFIFIFEYLNFSVKQKDL